MKGDFIRLCVCGNVWLCLEKDIAGLYLSGDASNINVKFNCVNNVFIIVSSTWDLTTGWPIFAPNLAQTL